jgi:hypothetical protein
MGIVDPMAPVMLIGAKSRNLLMTGGTGMGAVYREPAIVKQFATQLKAFFG